MSRFCPECGGRLVEQPRDGRMRPVCERCGYVLYINPSVAAGVLAEREGQVVLVRRAVDPGKGKWGLPAGYLEGDETAEQGAVRECLEETGLEVVITDLIDVYSFGKEAERTGVLIVYAAQVIGGTLRAGDDATEARFFGPLELPEEIAFSTHRRALADWHRAKAIHYRQATVDEAPIVSELNDRHHFDRPRDYAAYIRSSQSALYVAVDRQQIVGLSGVSLQNGDHIAHIDLVFVLPNYRRWGIATHLIERCVAFGRDRTARAVVAEVPATNPALALYLRAGFRVSGFNNIYYPPDSPAGSTALFLAYDLDTPRVRDWSSVAEQSGSRNIKYHPYCAEALPHTFSLAKPRG